MYAPHTAGVNIVPVILVCLFIPPPPWNLHGSAAVNIVPVILVCLFITPPPPPMEPSWFGWCEYSPGDFSLFIYNPPPPMEPSWFGWCEYSPGDFSLFIYNPPPPPMEPSWFGWCEYSPGDFSLFIYNPPPPPWNLHGSAGVNIVPVILVCLFITPPMEPSWFGWCEYSPGDFSLFIYNPPPPMEPSWFGWCEYSPGDFSLFIYNPPPHGTFRVFVPELLPSALCCQFRNADQNEMRRAPVRLPLPRGVSTPGTKSTLLL